MSFDHAFLGVCSWISESLGAIMLNIAVNRAVIDDVEHNSTKHSVVLRCSVLHLIVLRRDVLYHVVIPCRIWHWIRF